MDTIRPSDDGYYHPASEEEIADLVKQAERSRAALRVVGAGRSEWDALYPSLVPPGVAGGGAARGGPILLLLDRLSEVTIHDAGNGEVEVEVEAGVSFRRLAAQLCEHGYALPDLGASSQLTVAGFLSTGSQGGSLQHSFLDAVLRLRFVDGRGEIHELVRGQERFAAAGVSMGLYGVITRVWLRVEPSYNLVGGELCAPMAQTALDFFGEATAKIPLRRYLTEMPHACLAWWPQRDIDRVALWGATHVEPMPLFEAVPHQRLEPDAPVTSLAAGLLLTILGNLDDPSEVSARLASWYAPLDRAARDQVLAVVRGALEKARPHQIDEGPVSHVVRGSLRAASVAGADFAGRVEKWWDERIADAIVELIRGSANRSLSRAAALGIGKLIGPARPYLARSLASLCVVDGDRRFQDSWPRGLALDEQRSERSWPLRFMELAVPLDRAEGMMKLLRDYFRADQDAAQADERCGPLSWQISAGKKNDFWMSHAHGSDVIRINGSWYRHNAGDPRDRFFRDPWELLEPLGFRPHWGKLLPLPAPRWAAYYERQLPRMRDFKVMRAEYDPEGIFVTSYWREHLGL